MTTPDLLPLRPYTVTVLGSLIKDHVFYILPRAELWADNPRELPREQVVNDGTFLSETGKRKRGRPSKHEKAMKNKAMLNKLEKWMEDTTYHGLSSSANSAEQSGSMYLLLANPPRTTLEHYEEQKSQLLGALLSTEEGLNAVRGASATVLEQLKGAKELVADEEQSGDFTGLERAERACEEGCGLLGLMGR